MTITRIKKGKPHLFSDVTSWGGKGDNLLKLSEVFDVPAGFVISAQNYAKWIADANLNAFVRNALRKEGKDAHLAICKKFLTTPLEQGLVSLLEPEFERLRKPIAVRSSSITEDSGRNSYAGQLETVLGVNDFAEFLCAIRAVYASLFTARAVEYRRQQKLSADDSIAVVVQLMISPSVSGVVYSPSPNNRNEILIESTWGLCTSIVDGRPCDIYRVLDTVTGNVIEDISSKKTEMDVFDRNNVVTKQVARENRGKSSLIKEQVLEVAKTAKSIERCYGVPIDIEFAYEAETNKLYILQARPITGMIASEENIVLPKMPVNRILARSKNIRKQGIFEGPAVVVRQVDHANRSFSIDGDIEEMNKQFSQGYILLAPEIPPQLEQLVSNARAMVVTECGTTGHAAAIACEKGIIYLGRAVSQIADLLSTVRSGVKIGVAASKEEGIVYSLR